MKSLNGERNLEVVRVVLLSDIAGFERRGLSSAVWRLHQRCNLEIGLWRNFLPLVKREVWKWGMLVCLNQGQEDSLRVRGEDRELQSGQKGNVVRGEVAWKLLHIPHVEGGASTCLFRLSAMSHMLLRSCLLYLGPM